MAAPLKSDLKTNMIGLPSWAAPCGRPLVIPRSRPRGVKAQGLRFEAALAEALPMAKHGQWWEYLEEGQKRWCQTDLTFNWAGFAVVIECKLSWVPQGQESLDGLYLPVLQRALGRKVLGLVAVKNLRRGCPHRVVGDLRLALHTCQMEPTVLHWLPGTPLLAAA